MWGDKGEEYRPDRCEHAAGEITASYQVRLR